MINIKTHYSCYSHSIQAPPHLTALLEDPPPPNPHPAASGLPFPTGLLAGVRKEVGCTSRPRAGPRWRRLLPRPRGHPRFCHLLPTNGIEFVRVLQRNRTEKMLC